MNFEEADDVKPNDKILELLEMYFIQAGDATNHKKRETIFRDMISHLMELIKELAEDGDSYEVGEYLYSAAYYLEEFNFKEAQHIYIQSIEHYDKFRVKEQKLGKFEEASWVSYKIAEIYHEKLGDQESEKKYIQKCIEYKEALYEILNGFSKPRKLATLLYNLGELYARINNLERALEFNNLTLELAKEQRFYDIIANTYLNMSDVYLFMDDEINSREYIEEARQYFSQEEKQCTKSGNFRQLSQIYQILKTINAEINDQKEFVKFSRKEAKSYVDLAKQIHREKLNYFKLANFYKGAAICFKETDYLECATCYYLAARIFQQIGEFSQANSCYSEAAELFEEVGLYKKAIELYCQAGDASLNNNDLEFAIEKFMNAFDLLSRENINFQKNELAEKIETNLILLSDINAKENRFFIAGTLLLETLFYYKKAGLQKTETDINKLLNRIKIYYHKEYKEHADSSKTTWVAYMLALTAIAHISLGKLDKAMSLIAKLKSIENSSQTIKAYREITELIHQAKNEDIKFTLSNLDKKSKKIYSGLEEVKLFNNLLFY
ncbi:MAG: DUF2225 domain-containing protein [Promethearchaeota archaeon]|nr:MAG: DUF2225 domain-containing protein [Candidatus Lokiarchaeota archaeon]